MASKVYNTEINSKRGHITIYQDGTFMYYKYRLDSIVFFTTKDNEYTRLGQIPAFNKEFDFTLKTEKLNKVPVKRVEKVQKEKFFFINHTMFIYAEAIHLFGPQYKKIERKPEFLSPSLTETNYALEEAWYWNTGFFAREIMWDTQDYLTLRNNMEMELNELGCTPYYFSTLNNMDIAVKTIQDTKAKIQERMDWWVRASVQDMVSYYQSQVKGDKKNA